MKRSDMIKELASELILGMIEKELNPVDFKIAQELVDRVLNLAEENQMGLVGKSYCFNGKIFHEILVWEPEDNYCGAV